VDSRVNRASDASPRPISTVIWRYTMIASIVRAFIKWLNANGYIIVRVLESEDEPYRPVINTDRLVLNYMVTREGEK
jgi:hypothetical protein